MNRNTKYIKLFNKRLLLSARVAEDILALEEYKYNKRPKKSCDNPAEWMAYNYTIMCKIVEDSLKINYSNKWSYKLVSFIKRILHKYSKNFEQPFSYKPYKYTIDYIKDNCDEPMLHELFDVIYYDLERHKKPEAYYDIKQHKVMDIDKKYSDPDVIIGLISFYCHIPWEEVFNIPNPLYEAMLEQAINLHLSHKEGYDFSFVNNDTKQMNDTKIDNFLHKFMNSK